VLLVEWKLEHGFDHLGRIRSQDEIGTMDSSRYWLLDDYNEQFKLYTGESLDRLEAYLIETQPGIKPQDYTVNGEIVMSPKSYSKEFARGFSRGESGYNNEERFKIAVRYVEGIQILLGQRFEPDMRPRDEIIIDGLNTAIEVLNL
jgi:hypothetical protein